MIVLLLLGFLNLPAAMNYECSSTGSKTFADTTVTIDIDNIRNANALIVQGKYYKTICNEQDSIILMQKDYINKQQDVITDFQNRVIEANKLNNKFKEDLNKQIRKTKYLGYCSLAIIVGIVTGIILK